MNKISYITPATRVLAVRAGLPLAASNQINGSGIDFNKSTMETGDGDDAAAKGSGNWDNIWND